MARTTRRSFVRKGAVFAIAPALVASSLSAQTAPAVAPDTPAEPPKLDPKSSLARAQTDIVRAKWADYLTYDELATIEGGLDRMSRYQKSMAKFELRNGDEPDSVFEALS